MNRLLNLVTVLGLVLLPGSLPAAGLLNLRKPEKPRFEITDPVWPEKVGEPSICLWEDDKLAAFSFGVDDNNAQDVDWWLATCQEYNLHITWFLITNNIDGATDSARVKSAGTWGKWKSVLEAGHAIESHSVNHLAKVGQPDWKGTEWEYSQSQADIQEHIPGYQVYCIAYPGGKGDETNDPNLAAKYYLAGRGGRPFPNQANATDYMSINASSRPYVAPLGEDPKQDFANFNYILKDDPKNKMYRGWAFGFAHYVGTPEFKESNLKVLNWYKANSDKLWGGLTRDVARYGQERDTAKLVVDENTASRICFTLTDEMDDRFYNYPLTIKVRLPSAWSGVTVTQKDKEIPVNLVQKDNATFALIKAIPDGGQVTIVPKS